MTLNMTDCSESKRYRRGETTNIMEAKPNKLSNKNQCPAFAAVDWNTHRLLGNGVRELLSNKIHTHKLCNMPSPLILVHLLWG